MAMFGIDAEDDGALGILPGTTGNVDPTSAFPIAGDAGVALGTGTGQHGVRPLPGINLGGPAGMLANAFNSIWTWLNRPLNTPMAPTDIALVVGIIMIAIIIWNFFLYHLRIAAESI